MQRMFINERSPLRSLTNLFSWEGELMFVFRGINCLSQTPKEVAREVPLERLVVETDSPYLSPHPLRGTVNEPSNLSLVVDAIADIRDMSKKHLLDILYQNSCDLFKL